ncbi:hypothetical protein BH23ACT6_BH23ACT6_23760 [soil metagenome]
MDVTLLHFDGCPSWQTTDQRLRELADEHGFDVTHRKVETPEAAEELSFRGSPTVLIDGRDPFADGDEPVGLSCRIYQTPDGQAGSPTLDQLRGALDAR